jgi:O-Antigen ligase
MLGAWFLLYALLGKGFAYAGYAPLYVGEILLAVGVVAMATTVPSGHLGSLARTPIGAILIVFMTWELACSLPYIDVYGTDVFRDGVIWGYALLAWATAAMVLRLRGFISTAISQFARFGRIYLILGPAAWIATSYWRDYLPVWSGTVISIPLIKGGEYCVHIAGIFAFLMQGLGIQGSTWMIIVIADALLAMSVRGGLLAFVVASAVAVLMRPRVERIFPILLAGVLIIGAMALFDVRFSAPVADRELSLAQLTSSLQSVVGASDRSDLEGTKQWRLGWWRKIWEYTFEGEYFWMGRGYGINLADSDGFQVGTPGEPLRSPHSAHLTFLARSGVPGFVLWILLQVAFITQLLRAYFKARQYKATVWIGLFSWVFAYWVAFTVSASFDVFLEGPMAGIPYWILFGFGWGAQVLFQFQRAKLESTSRVS